MDDEAPRYTPAEMFDRYVERLNSQTPRFTRHGIRTWQHEALRWRLIAYLKHADFSITKGTSERRKTQMCGEPTKGDVFHE